MPIAPSEALSPRSANLPMKPLAATKTTKAESKPKTTQPATNPDKIDERWRPSDVVKEPQLDGETYLTGKKLGRGGFAVCFEGRSEKKGQLFALKVVKSVVQQKKQLEKFRTELQIHAKMHHPSIVDFYRAFAFENHTYVVLELCCNGSLMEMVKNRRSLTLPEVRRYMIQLCSGVKYMHQRCVIHRDLKMGNIFIDSNMNLKIGDFGLAAVVVDDKERRQTMCGTPNYIAPELLARSSATRGHGHKVDTWAMGIICYAMLIGTPPFASKSQNEIYAKLKQLQYEWKEDCQYFIPAQAKHLVTLCLNLDPYQRPGMDELVEHEFFKMGAVAQQLDRSALRSQPAWLQHADPRGDKVSHGYGEDYTTFCASLGVGKTPSGISRHSIGVNVDISAMAEVHLENAKGCAPIVPMPNGVIYREVMAEPEEPLPTRRRPAAATQVRSRKEKTATSLQEQRASSKDLPTMDSLRAISAARGAQTLPSRAPIQSFAAQQRQQAAPVRTNAARIISDRGPRQLSREIENSTPVRQVEGQDLLKFKADTMPPEKNPASQSQRLLREQPMRVGRVTRSATTRNMIAAEALPTKTADSVSGASRIALRTASDQRDQPSIPASIRARTTSRTAALSKESELAKPQTGELSRPKSRSRLRPVDGNDRNLSTDKILPKLPGQDDQLPEPASYFRPALICPDDPYTLVPNSSRASTVYSLRTLYRSLSPNHAHSASSFSDSYLPHAVVEKWVDYTDRYGIGYILSDGSAGEALRSSPDNTRPSTFAVLRHARTHFARRIRHEELQIVPQSHRTPPIEFYEAPDPQEGLRKLTVPTRKFRIDPLKLDQHSASKSATDSAERGWPDPPPGVLSHMCSRAADSFASERVRLVSLLDKFGKYMTTSPDASGHDENSSSEAQGNFIRFYQRLGNVGIWGFADGAFQCNFPDHTKLVVYRAPHTIPPLTTTATPNAAENPLLLDLYYLQPHDAQSLAAHGIVPDKGLERRDSLTLPIADLFRVSNLRGELAQILDTNQVREKIAWIRGVVGVWVREGGLGKMGKERLAWKGLKVEAGREDKREGRKEKGGKKARLVWVSVGREGGDGEKAF